MEALGCVPACICALHASFVRLFGSAHAGQGACYKVKFLARLLSKGRHILFDKGSGGTSVLWVSLERFYFFLGGVFPCKTPASNCPAQS